jgi:hypothetical protein
MVVKKASSRVPGRAPGSSRSCLTTAAACSMFRGKAICPLGFSHRGDFIGEGAASGGGPGGLTTGGCDQGLGCAPWW